MKTTVDLLRHGVKYKRKQRPRHSAFGWKEISHRHPKTRRTYRDASEY